MKQNASIFNEAFNQSIIRSLEKNQAINEIFPDWGRIHIDRRLPFLCLYRRPTQHNDSGTEQLLLGQASYIMVREEDAESKGFRSLIMNIMKVLSSHYSNALLFEIWSEDVSDIEMEDIELIPLLLAIKTSKHHAPIAMLEQFERALLEIPIENNERIITLDYTKHCSPQYMTPVFNNKKFNSGGNSDNRSYWVGLCITSIYRLGDEVFPYILRNMQRWLTLVLRRSFFTFTHSYTVHKPAHYHQLGRQSLTDSIWMIDKQLSEIKEQFELLFHVTPVNSDEAWSEFQASNYNKTPAFNYRPRPIDTDLLKRQLYNIPVENIEDPTLSFIFQSQRDEIDRQLSMINDRNNRKFLYGSLQVYGGVDSWLLNIANEILAELEPENMSACQKSISAIEFAERAEQLLKQYQVHAPDMQSRIVIRDDIPGVLVSKGHLMIGHNSRFLESRIAGTLAHEVGTHIVTYVNGKAQPFHQFHSGMADYEPLQEGLAVLAEYLVGELSAGRLRRLAARVIAVHGLVAGADFIDVFRLLHLEHKFTAYQSYYITMRAFRGGGFTKDLVYLKGFTLLLDYLGDGGELNILYLGKIAQDDIPFVEELRWRKVLKDGPLQPHFLQSEKSKKLMQKISSGLSITQLIQELKL